MPYDLHRCHFVNECFCVDLPVQSRAIECRNAVLSRVVADTWLKCSACKAPIPFGAIHQVCSVSTCNRSRTRLVFCSVACWDSHVAMLRHRDAWAVEERAPTKEAWERELAENPPVPAPVTSPATARIVASSPAPAPAAAPVRVVAASAAAPGPVQLSATDDHDVLIVVSKMKKYIKDRSGMNCGDAVAGALSDHVRAICDEAIRAAARDERKTVLDRDVPRPPRR